MLMYYILLVSFFFITFYCLYGVWGLEAERLVRPAHRPSCARRPGAQILGPGPKGPWQNVKLLFRWCHYITIIQN